jgi:uncharacterized SAM-binding protein YcdF (DUF218 family)
VTPERAAAADAVVVLGCSVRGDAPSPALIRRVECGIMRFECGDAPLLLLCGGGPGNSPEARVMRDIAIARNVPEAAIVLEPHSRNTFENAVETARLMRSKGLTSLVLVSDRYHLPRASLLFRHAGLIVLATDHPPTRGFWREMPLVARESLAFGLSLWRLLRAGRAIRNAGQLSPPARKDV